MFLRTVSDRDFQTMGKFAEQEGWGLSVATKRYLDYHFMWNIIEELPWLIAAT